MISLIWGETESYQVLSGMNSALQSWPPNIYYDSNIDIPKNNTWVLVYSVFKKLHIVKTAL